MAKSRADKLVDLFREERSAAAGSAPLVNRNSAHFVFKELFKDLEYAEVEALVTFFAKYHAEDFKWFQYNYESVYNRMLEHRKQAEDTAQLMSEAEARVKAWRERIERTKSN